MPTATEAAVARTPMGASLATGVDTLSLRQTVTFDLYVKIVLPIDGYVFWVKAINVSASALLNASALDAFALNQGSSQAPTPPPALTFKALGSCHYATDSRQTDDGNYAANRVVFTSEEPLQDMNSVGTNFMYIGTFDGPIPGTPEKPRSTTPIRFSFSMRGSYYQQSNLWHYTGFAIYPQQSTQVVDNPALIHPDLAIVSNSLPFWIAFSHYDPAWPVPVRRPPIQFYPAMLSPDNLVPPYVTVRILPTDTEAFQAMPFLSSTSDQSQGAFDRVRLTIYGANNDAAQDLLYSLLQYSYDAGDFGVCNIPTVRDEREGQNEINTLAQKKSIDFVISYNQTRVRNVARQLIERCLVNLYADDVFIGQV